MAPSRGAIAHAGATGVAGAWARHAVGCCTGRGPGNRPSLALAGTSLLVIKAGVVRSGQASSMATVGTVPHGDNIRPRHLREAINWLHVFITASSPGRHAGISTSRRKHFLLNGMSGDILQGFGSHKRQRIEHHKPITLLNNCDVFRVRGCQHFSNCVFVTAGLHDSESARAAGGPYLSTETLGSIHVEEGATLQLTNVLVTGASTVPLITVARGGTLLCCDSVLGPNVGIEQQEATVQHHEPPKQQQQQAGWCCCVSGTLIARRCSFFGGAAGCLALLGGASAELMQCSVAGSPRGKGAELQGPGAAIVARRCVFRDNHLAGCAVLGGAKGRFLACCFERAMESGGLVVHGEDSCAAAEDCVFADNSRSGVFVSTGGRAELTGCEVSDNRRYAGLEVKGTGSSACCRGCTIRDNARAEVYILAGAALELHGGVLGSGGGAVEHSIWAKDPGTVVRTHGVTLEHPRLTIVGADVRIT
jgi:hypothetical protein